MKRMNKMTRMTKSTRMTWITGMKGMTRMTWGQFNKTFTRVIYKCSYCSQTLKQRLHFYRCKSFIKLTPGWPG